MPAPNDLTPEEEQMFVEHGVQPAGPGAEPIAEGLEEAAPEAAGPEGAEAPAPVEVSRHRDDGTFKSKEEYEAEVAAAQEAAATAAATQPKMVPHEALHEARAKLAEQQRNYQTLLARTNAMLMAQQRGPQAQDKPMPDIATDPAGFVIALSERLERFEQAQAQQNEFRQIDSALENDEAQFSQMVPDYDAASDYYVQSRAKELLQFYPPEQAQQMLMREARQIAQQAWARGMSAAQTVYGLAQARGFQPGNTAADPMKNPIPPQQQPTAQHQRGPTPQATVAAINQGQQASRSLSGGGAGGQDTGQLNAEALLAMSDEEFEQHLALGAKGANTRFAALG